MNWKEIVGSVAPTLGVALGGPFGGMAGKFIAESLGVKDSELEEALTDPSHEVLLQIKQLETQFQTRLAELGLEESKLHTQSQASARHMAINTTLMPQAIISAIFILGFIGVLYMVFKGEVDLSGAMKDAALMLLGILSAGITQILNFFFGSSSGSKEKTALMGERV